MEFKDVYDEHFRFVWRSLRRLGVPEPDAPDAAQEVFLVVHRRLSEFEGRSSMSTWLFGICLRVAAARRRSSRTRNEVASDAAPDAPDEANDVVAAAERRDALRQLDGILEQMSLEQRAVFTLFELDGLSGDEIAAMLDVPRGTVHSRLRLAREAFRAAVGRLHRRESFRYGGGQA